jgi:predicted transcriptional regulator YdeE
MNQLILDNAITVYTVKAASFPDGVLAAHQHLHGLAPYSVKRRYFGISRPEGAGTIVYYAAAEELEKGEFARHDLPVFTIAAGTYSYTDIPDFMKNIPAIGQTFQALLGGKNIDPSGACVEWYLSDSVCRCMVRIIPVN